MNEPTIETTPEIIDQIERTHIERCTPGAPYVSDRRFLEFIEHHLPGILRAARRGLAEIVEGSK